MRLFIAVLAGALSSLLLTLLIQRILSNREAIIASRMLRKMRLDPEDDDIAKAFCIPNKEKRIDNAKLKQRKNKNLLNAREEKCNEKMSELNRSRRKLKRILEEIEQQETPGEKNLKIKVDLGGHLPMMAEIVSAYAAVVEQYVVKYATDSFWDAVSTGDSKSMVINYMIEHKNSRAESVNNFEKVLKQAEEDLTLGVEQLERSLELWTRKDS